MQSVKNQINQPMKQTSKTITDQTNTKTIRISAKPLQHRERDTSAKENVTFKNNPGTEHPGNM